MTSVQVCAASGAAFASGRRPRDTARSGWKAPARTGSYKSQHRIQIEKKVQVLMLDIMLMMTILATMLHTMMVMVACQSSSQRDDRQRCPFPVSGSPCRSGST